MKRFFPLIFSIILLTAVCSCNMAEILYEAVVDAPNLLEPNSLVSFTLNGEDYEYTSRGVPVDSYALFYNTKIVTNESNVTFLSIDVCANTPPLFQNGFFLNLSTTDSWFSTARDYPIEEFNVINKYGHLCQKTGDWNARFILDGLKSYEAFELRFEADCQDPDTGEIYHFRNGRFICCKNSFTTLTKKQKSTDYIKAD